LCISNLATTGEYGPAWLEYSFDDVDDAAESYKAAAAAQLEKEGLAFRKRRLFTATRCSRWEALEIQVSWINGIRVQHLCF
jgi:hypothetical protein